MIDTDTLLKLQRLLDSMETANRLNVGMSIWNADIELLNKVVKHLKGEK